jgi:hypothetical protein
MTVNNNMYHLSGVGNRVVPGDDNSVNAIKEKELFDRLASVISTAVEDVAHRKERLEKLDQLRHETSKTDYLTKLTKFLAAAGSITHAIAPYLPALTDKSRIIAFVSPADQKSAQPGGYGSRRHKRPVGRGLKSDGLLSHTESLVPSFSGQLRGQMKAGSFHHGGQSTKRRLRLLTANDC